MSTIWVFNYIENKHTLYRGEDCMKKFCSSLRDHATNIVNSENKKNITVRKTRVKIKSRCNRSWKRNFIKAH